MELCYFQMEVQESEQQHYVTTNYREKQGFLPLSLSYYHLSEKALNICVSSWTGDNPVVQCVIQLPEHFLLWLIFKMVIHGYMWWYFTAGILLYVQWFVVLRYKKTVNSFHWRKTSICAVFMPAAANPQRNNFWSTTCNKPYLIT